MAGGRTRSTLVGVSLKMYFGHRETLEWCTAVADLAAGHPAIRTGAARLFVIPGYLSVTAAIERFGDSALVGAQDLATEDRGPFTGEVSGAELREVGCSVVEVGHAERRRLFGETPDVVRAKTAAALRNGLAPVLCIGEAERGDAATATADCIAQLDDALGDVLDDARSGTIGDGPGVASPGRVIVAYEPHWAIGAPRPAGTEHIRAVCSGLRLRLAELVERGVVTHDSGVVYGGSAGPGLLTEIGADVDGLFLGRFAHDPEALSRVLDETLALHSTEPGLQQ